MAKGPIRPPPTIGDAPIQVDLYDVMNVIARTIDRILNGDPPPVPQKWEKKWGFVMLCYPFGEKEGRCNYISNSDRVDVKVLLKEQLARFEGMPEVKTRTKQ